MRGIFINGNLNTIMSEKMKSYEVQTKYREKRDCQRMPVDIEIEYDLWNPLVWKKRYTGTIKNLSEKGMLISTRTINFLMDALLEIFIPVKKEVVFIPARNSTIVWRRMASDYFCVAIGIKLSDQHHDYLEFIESLKAAQ